MDHKSDYRRHGAASGARRPSDDTHKHTHSSTHKDYLRSPSGSRGSCHVPQRSPPCSPTAPGAARAALRREAPLRQRSAPSGGLVVVAAAGAAEAKDIAADAELLEEVAQELARLDSCPPLTAFVTVTVTVTAPP